MYEYNPALLERMVKRMQRSARRGMILIPVFVALVGVAIGAGYAYWARFYLVRDLLVFGAIGGAIGLMAGILVGLSNSAKAREQAQIALGILRIEQNTRPQQMDTPDFIPLDTSSQQ